MKGRANYLCLHRFHRFLQQPELFPGNENILTQKLAAWAHQTASGDRAEIHWLPDDFDGWEQINARGDRCLGQKCPMFEQCFLSRLRQQAATAEIVVVNHHLFFADLAVRSDGYGQVIPPYEVVVFDEAHQLEETASSYFSRQVSSYRLFELLGDVSREMVAARSQDTSLPRLVQGLGVLSARFFEAIPAQQKRQRFQPKNMSRDFHQLWSELSQSLEQLIADLFRQQDLSEELSGCHRRAVELSQTLEMMLDQSDETYVYWYETRGKGKFLWASPVQVAPILQELLFSRSKPYIFTSATLAVGNSLEFFKTRLGLPLETVGTILDTPFSYREQTVIYLPKDLPLPDSSGFIPALTEELAAILAETHGRAFILFTSYRNLREVHSRLGLRKRFTLLVQGEKPKAVLLSQFREDTSSVLLGTSSFWQGVDMPGETLSCVIIDKLPFAPPDDPIVAARLEKIAEGGGSPFWQYQVPTAVLSLRQGLGRLIRRTTDRGVLAVLDSRLFKRSYGKIFLESLPESSITHKREDIGKFLKGRW
jgi:ATP-dependent DNA helicase DinG